MSYTPEVGHRSNLWVFFMVEALHRVKFRLDKVLMRKSGRPRPSAQPDSFAAAFAADMSATTAKACFCIRLPVPMNMSCR